MAIGERLREARMRQKIDVADVEAATKIRAKYLRALENEEFGLLPGNTFVKTFLRTYAEYLGLDPQLLLEEYRAEYEPRGDAEIQPYSVAARQRQRPHRQRSRAPSGPPGPGTALIVAVGVIVVILLILGLFGGGGKDENASSPGSTTKKQKPATTTPTKREKPKPTTIKLRITPSTPTYLCVDRGPGTPVVDQRTITGQANYKGKHLRVNLGKSSVKVRVNGKLVSIPQGPEAVGYDFQLHSDGKVASNPIPAGQTRPCG